MSKKNASKAKKIYNIVSTAIIAAIFVFLAVIVGLVIAQRKQGEDFKLFGYYMYQVVTDSMSGTIEPGEVILSKEIKDVNALKEGDIITFTAPSGPLKGYNETHRINKIVYKENGEIDYLITKGDHGEQVDSWHLDPSAVKAIFVKKSVFITGFRKFLSKWYGFVVLIALPLTIVFVLIIVGYVRDRVALEEEKSPSRVSVDSLSDEDKRKLLEAYLDAPAEGGEEGKDGSVSDSETQNGGATEEKHDAPADPPAEAKQEEGEEENGEPSGKNE